MKNNFKNNFKGPLVSVLTPVYNGETYLEECIESVLSQTYRNIEYVIVNNCSTDRTLKIAEKYAHKDNRIRIHNNDEHLPIMQNLNHAFRQISSDSKYCKVIHADDWLFPECVERMVKLSEKYPEIGLVSSYRLVQNNIGPSGLDYARDYISGKEICRRFLLKGEFYFGAPSTILLRADLIRKRNKVYDESYLQGDVAACLDILKESDFGFVHQVLSFTRRHKNSITERKTKKYSRFMYGYLKIHLDYAPFFLTEEEKEKKISERIRIFYIQFARNIINEKFSKKVYRRHKADLEALDLSFRPGKLFKHVIIEIVRLPFINYIKSKRDKL